MALTKTTKKTSSIIKTRSQSRTDSRTIAPAPAPVVGRTTGTTHDPVANDPVITTTPPVDLFAGRPTTGTLKDPPPVPRDRDSDSDDDANKQEACCQA